MGALPDRKGRAVLVAVALVIATLAQTPAMASPDCTATLMARAAQSGGSASDMALQYTAPCAPYAAVILNYGPLKLGEETDANGALALVLPRLPGVQIVSIDQVSERATVVIPSSEHPIPSVTAVIWPDGERWGRLGATMTESGPVTVPSRLHRLGFVGRGALADLITGDAPAHLDIPVTVANCGRTLTALVMLADTIEPLTIALPDCDGIGGTLHLPLARPNKTTP